MNQLRKTTLGQRDLTVAVARTDILKVVAMPNLGVWETSEVVSLGTFNHMDLLDLMTGARAHGFCWGPGFGQGIACSRRVTDLGTPWEAFLVQFRLACGPDFA